MQGGLVLGAVFFLLLPFYLAGSESPIGGMARVVECHRAPMGLWLYYQCRLAPPDDALPAGESPLGYYAYPATSYHRLHGIGEFELHGYHARGKGDLIMVVPKGTPGLPGWIGIVIFLMFFPVTLLIVAIEQRVADRLAKALRGGQAYRSGPRAGPGETTDSGSGETTD